MAKFQVTIAPGYFDNVTLHPPGTVLDLSPEEYQHVSLSFKPMDAEAEGMIARKRKEDPASAEAFRGMIPSDVAPVELKPIQPLKVHAEPDKKAVQLRK